MSEKLYNNIQNSEENETFNNLSKDTQHFVIHSQENLTVLINALDKYEQFVKRHIDPDINRQETILIVSALIEKLANSLPKYIEEDQGVKQGIKDLIKEVREKGVLMNDSLNQSFIKFLLGVTVCIASILAFLVACKYL